MSTGLARTTYNEVLLVSYVPIIEMIGSLDEAEREYQRAARGLPRSGPIMALAGVARRRGHTDDECAFLAKTVDLLRGRPILPLQLLADAEMRAGHPEEALDAMDRRWLWADTGPGCGTSRKWRVLWKKRRAPRYEGSKFIRAMRD